MERQWNRIPYAVNRLRRQRIQAVKMASESMQMEQKYGPRRGTGNFSKSKSSQSPITPGTIRK